MSVVSICYLDMRFSENNVVYHLGFLLSTGRTALVIHVV